MKRDVDIKDINPKTLEKMKRKQFQKPSYYAVCPAEIRYAKDLKANEKLLFSELLALSQKDGFCYATNKYLAWLLELKKDTICKMISKLEKLNYIKTIYFWNKEHNFIEVRLIKCIISKKSKMPKNMKFEKLEKIDWFKNKKKRENNENN